MRPNLLVTFGALDGSTCQIPMNRREMTSALLDRLSGRLWVARSRLSPLPIGGAIGRNREFITLAVRPIHQPVKALSLRAGQPSVQRLARHSHLLGDSEIDNPSLITAITACPAARPRSTPSSRECHESTETTVAHQPKDCQASPEDKMSRITRGNTTRLWDGRGSNPRPTDYESARTCPCVTTGAQIPLLTSKSRASPPMRVHG